MDSFLYQFRHLKIQLEELISATNDFDNQNNYIGGGGFGKVYKGQVSHSKGRSMVAIKRLDPKYGQGIPEFLKEITTLSRYNHENLISLLGFCYQGDEMILVYEHASRGSLDRHLSSSHLTWLQRLKICLDAAKGLSYLHDPRETHQRLIHCDMKSANILLDEQWRAKVSDFGLSIMGPANEKQSVIVTTAVGTHGYCDPQYAMTHTLTKESDVYSFGVVIFEVLCGRLCCTYSNGHVQQNLVPTWIESYNQKKLNDIIFKSPTIQPLDQSALEIFSYIARRCLEDSREDRPNMAEVVTELEIAFESQELVESHKFNEWEAQLLYYEELNKSAEPPLKYRSKVELRKLLSKGVLLNGGKTWFSLRNKREHFEMISFEACLDSGPNKFESTRWSSEYNSRFAVGPYYYENSSVKTRVKTQFLSPGLTYKVNLVFKFGFPARKCQRIYLEYKLQEETKTSISYLAYERKDGWWMCELYQFTSDQRSVDLEILFKGFYYSHIYIVVEGIEFQPVEKVCHNNNVEHKDEKQPITDLGANWEEKLAIDYDDIMKWSKDSVEWTTKKEAYSILRKGFLINDGQEWFSLDKNGKKCYMLSARAACIEIARVPRMEEKMLRWRCLPKSRFGEAVWLIFWGVTIKCHIQPQLVSPQTTYATYLVYKLSENQSRFEAPAEVKVENVKGFVSDYHEYIYLVTPQTPFIKSMADQNTRNLVPMPKVKGLPQQRNDGWMEVQIWEFQTATTIDKIPMCLQLTNCARTHGTLVPRGLTVQGIEFRPI